MKSCDGNEARCSAENICERFNRVQAVSLIERLLPLLDTGNSASLELLQEIDTILGPLGEEAILLMDQMREYDFDLAYETALNIRISVEE